MTARISASRGGAVRMLWTGASWTNHPVFKPFPVFIFHVPDFSHFLKSPVQCYYFLACVFSALCPLVPFIIYLFIHSSGYYGCSPRCTNKYSPRGIPKWRQVNSNEDNVFWTSNTSSVIFLSSLFHSWHLGKGNCLDAKCWKTQTRLLQAILDSKQEVTWNPLTPLSDGPLVFPGEWSCDQLAIKVPGKIFSSFDKDMQKKS